MMDEPYFITNPDWYKFSLEKGRYVLTDDAPEDARVSYEKFYAELERGG